MLLSGKKWWWWWYTSRASSGRRVNFEWCSPLFFIDTLWMWRWEMLCDYSNYYYYYYYCYYRYYCSDFLRWCLQNGARRINFEYIFNVSNSDTLNLIEKHCKYIRILQKRGVVCEMNGTPRMNFIYKRWWRANRRCPSIYSTSYFLSPYHLFVLLHY